MACVSKGMDFSSGASIYQNLIAVGKLLDYSENFSILIYKIRILLTLDKDLMWFKEFIKFFTQSLAHVKHSKMLAK